MHEVRKAMEVVKSLWVLEDHVETRLRIQGGRGRTAWVSVSRNNQLCQRTAFLKAPKPLGLRPLSIVVRVGACLRRFELEGRHDTRKPPQLLACLTMLTPNGATGRLFPLLCGYLRLPKCPAFLASHPVSRRPGAKPDIGTECGQHQIHVIDKALVRCS